MNAALDADIRAINRLIEDGADVNATDARGWTALDLAAAWAATSDYYGDYRTYETVVKPLLAAGGLITHNTIEQVNSSCHSSSSGNVKNRAKLC